MQVNDFTANIKAATLASISDQAYAHAPNVAIQRSVVIPATADKTTA